MQCLCFRPQEIDEAARRRFVKRLYIPLPELGARKTIIQNLLRQQKYHLTEEQLGTMCSRTDGKKINFSLWCDSSLEPPPPFVVLCIIVLSVASGNTVTLSTEIVK